MTERIQLPESCTSEFEEAELAEALQTDNAVRNCVLAVLFSRRSDDEDVRNVQMGYGGGVLTVEPNGLDITHHLNTVKLLARLIVDTLRPVNLRETVKRAGLMDQLEGDPTIIMMGGHKVPRIEQRFGEKHGEIVTRRLLTQYGKVHWGSGSGDGMMKAAFVGARKAHREVGRKSEMMVGVTNPSVLAYEWPNEHVRALMVTKNMKGRFELFARLTSILGAYPGGIGTVHEIMQGIAMALYGDNREVGPPIHVVERPGGQWTDALRPFLHTAFTEEELDGTVGIYKGSSAKYAEVAASSIGHVDAYNDRIIMPPDITTRETATAEDSEGVFTIMQELITVTHDMQPWERAAYLDWFFDMMLKLTFNRPEIAEEWKEQGTKVELKKNMDPQIATELFNFLTALRSRLAVDKIGAEELITDN